MTKTIKPKHNYMKNNKNFLKLLAAIIIVTSCSPQITTVLMDYRPYSQEGFLVTPNPYYGEYESLGEILISYPAYMVNASQNNFKVTSSIPTVRQEISTDTAKVSGAPEGYKRYIYVKDGGKTRDTVLVRNDQKIDIITGKPASQPNNSSMSKGKTPQDILESIVKTAKSIGADAVTNFEFLIKYQGSTLVSYEVSGYCIKRLD